MRILTVRQPWAWAIIHGGKTIENRVRNIAGDYRGPVAIHAAQLWDTRADTLDVTSALREVMDAQRPHVVDGRFPWSVFGAIIGVVDLVDVHDPVDPLFAPTADSAGACSPWAERGAFHLVLANPRALDQPIPWKGALGLRKTNLFVSGDWLGEYIDPGHFSCTPYGCPPSCYSEPVARLVATEVQP